MSFSIHARQFCFATMLFGLLSPAPALAQRGQDAGLVGTVRDRSGAVLTAATVTASSPQLIGEPLTATTDARGAYRFTLLPPGIYQFSVVQAGFKQATRTGVALIPGLTFTVDFQLDVAAVAEAVRVDAPAPIVDVRTSSSPTLIDRTLIENLPLSRTVTDSVNLAPGVVQRVAYGGSVSANPFSMDGTNGNEPGWGTPIATPNLNWIEELQIVSLGADAQYGEFTGAQQNAITRSGSNRFSGLGGYWTTRAAWTGNNRGGLTPQLQERFRPIEIIERWDSEVQAGGPVLRNRLWFFSGGEAYRDVNRPISFSGIAKKAEEPRYAADERKFITKLTGALSPGLRAEGYVTHNTTSVTGANAGPFVQPEALAIVDRAETMWNARFLWTISAAALVEVRHGGTNARRYGGPPGDRRFGPPGHYDQLTGIMSVNSESVGETLYRPITTSAHLTYMGRGPRGRSHEIRAGFEREHSRLYSAEGYVGGRSFQDYDGQPDTVYLWPGSIYRAAHDRTTLYLQDGWTPVGRVTLNLGVRAGFYSGGVPTHEDAFSARSLSPRIGGAWDVTGDHRTVLRLHYGRYHEGMVTSFYDFLDPLSQAPTVLAQVIGPDQFSEIARFGSTATAKIAPRVRYPYVREYLAAVERQLGWGISGKAQYIARDFKESIGFIDTGSVWQPVERIDPGPDGRARTADDGGPITVFVNTDQNKAALLLTNPAGAYRRYRAAQFVVSKRNSHDLDFQASYTWSRTVGSYNNAFSSNAANADLSTNGNFVNPNRRLNAEGRTPQDFTHEVKVLGSYRLRQWGGLNVGGVYRYQSGRPWARSANFGPQTLLGSILVEPRGTRQLPAVHTLDLRIEKTWKPAARFGRLGVFADVFNVNNQGVALRIANQSGPNFGVPNQWLEPRTLRAGARLMF